MAKYIVVEDFESKWLRPPNDTPQAAVFKKDTIIQAAPHPEDGRLVTRPDGTLPSFKEDKRLLVDVVESKVKMVKETDTNDKKDFMRYVYLVGAGLMVWWFIYGRDNKSKYTNESAGYY